MERDSFLALLRQHQAIAVIRADDINSGLHQAQAAAAGGIRLIEITWNSAQPEQLINTLRQQLTHCTVGIGTALSIADLKYAAAAGAQFCFCPHTDVRLIETAHALQVPIVPGALTPNEILAAWQAGASAVKVFPVNAVGGASYIRSLQGPLGHIPLVPTGGVTVKNVVDMVRAGAIAVGLSTSLFPKALVADRNWAAIEALATGLVEQLPTTDQAIALKAIAVPS
ncbi:bifunctional 4-hydroxy-2-oxoglutarate aldolase/2-dehydro-3-deoxy-phosphogluconate aldolase [Nodosilinea sp. AN01ver1]|uniref:bifunctional 4-hydroxy-2-oxoglutarate aldolase/2-dehydro-3-deoxy-phosphogluconate aldolase n=1 Tax=Nodosilinea sp. AN01ver1 TaxID=3423362 RepID=UPI003D3181BF